MSRWLLNLLRSELALYPGRLSIISRIVLSATLTALLIMIFQLPSASLGAFYTFILSRESPRATLQSAGRILLAFVLGTAYTLVGVILAVNYPFTHFLWVVATLLLIFFAIRVVPDYPTAAAFSFVIAVAIPVWDSSGPLEPHVDTTLWTTLSVGIGLVLTIGLEYLIQSFSSHDDLSAELEDRLCALDSLFRAAASGSHIPREVAEKLTQYATVGSSRLRQVLARSRLDPRYSGPMNTVVSLLDRAVDLAANFCSLELHPNDDERRRLLYLAECTVALRLAFEQKKPPPAEEISTNPKPAPGVPVLPELERTLALIPYAFAGETTISATPEPARAEQARPKLPWVEDAFTNLEHLRFAVRGTLAATASYIIYNALDWPGISTSLATCIITALSNIGSSRQKQLLRLLGAVLGGLVFGMGAQVLVFPAIDTITGFLLVFAAVNGIAAWISTASPRISYVGLQIVLAWDLINLSDPRFQLSLAIARDRVVGILVGLVCMWIFFEPLWPVSTAEYLLDILEANLRTLAQLPLVFSLRLDPRLTVARIRKLRDRLSAGFASLNAQADAVPFEIARNRRAQLEVRDHVLRWQPRLRTLLLLQLAVDRYRIDISLDTLAPSIAAAQITFDRELSQALTRLADHLQKANTPEVFTPDPLSRACGDLQTAIRNHYGAEIPARPQAILALSRAMVDLVINLSRDLLATAIPVPRVEARFPENRVPSIQTR